MNAEAAARARGVDDFDTNARKVYILPTRYGVLLGGALLLMLLVSVNYNNGLGHLFTFLLAGMAVVAMHYTQRNLVGIRLSVTPGRPVFAGETAQASVRIADTLHRPRHAAWLRGAGEDRRIDLDADGEARLSVSFDTRRRGLAPLPGLFLVSIYPMGLFCAWTRTLRGDSRQLVYPRPAREAPLPDGHGAEAGSRAHAGGSGDFDGLRDHRRGDPPSRIHWRASARGTGLKTKLFGGEGAGEVLLRYADAAGDAEARLSRLCRQVLDAETAGLRYAVELPAASTGFGRGPRHQQDCLALLALAEVGR